VSRPRALAFVTATSFVFAATFAACATPRTSESRSPEVVETTSEPAGDPAIETDLEVVQPRIEASGARKVLEFELRNRASDRRSFAYAVVWSDREDRRVGGPQRRWTLLTLEAGASAPVAIAFPPDGAESWRLVAVRPEDVR
jgi:hypothetical protein